MPFCNLFMERPSYICKPIRILLHYGGITRVGNVTVTELHSTRQMALVYGLQVQPLTVEVTAGNASTVLCKCFVCCRAHCYQSKCHLGNSFIFIYLLTSAKRH